MVVTYRLVFDRNMAALFSERAQEMTKAPVSRAHRGLEVRGYD